MKEGRREGKKVEEGKGELTLMSMFANNALLGGGVRVRVWIKRRSKALLCL